MCKSQVLICLIGLAVSSSVSGFQPPRTDAGAGTGDTPSATTPSQVWDSTASETAPAVLAKFLRHARRVVKKLDSDGSDALEEKEWAAMPGDPQKLDLNNDGAVTVEEMAEYLADYARAHPLHNEAAAWQRLPKPPEGIFQPVTPAEGPRKNLAADSAEPSANRAEQSTTGDSPSAMEEHSTEGSRDARKYYVPPSAYPPGLPDWFRQRDADGDGQLTLGEFAADGSPAQRRLFERYDLNGDGVITPAEVMRVAKPSPEKQKSSAAGTTPAEKKPPASANP